MCYLILYTLYTSRDSCGFEYELLWFHTNCHIIQGNITIYNKTLFVCTAFIRLTLNCSTDLQLGKKYITTTYTGIV